MEILGNYMKDFLLKTDASKEGLGVVLSQKQADGHYQPVAYGSRALTAHEKTYHSTKLEFLVLNGLSQNILRNTCCTNPS